MPILHARGITGRIYTRGTIRRIYTRGKGGDITAEQGANKAVKVKKRLERNYLGILNYLSILNILIVRTLT